MAYSKRGSRSIQVDRLTYRWRAEASTVVVWHVLDAGLLRVLPPPDLPFDPTPGFVARAIREARHRGWRTDAHFEMALDFATFRMLNPAETRVRTVVDAIELYGIGPFQAELGLRGVFCPAPGAPIVIEASEMFVVHGGPASVEAPCDPDWLRDVLVEVREAARTSTSGPQAEVIWVDPSGWNRWWGSTADPRARVAGAGLWRLGMRLLDPAGRRLLEPLHPLLELAEPPWEVDARRRVVRLYGVLRARDAQAFLGLLGTTGWVVDAHDLEGIDPEVVQALAPLRDLADVWVEPERRLERAWARTVEAGREQAKTSVVQAMARRWVPHLDSRWRDRALEALTRQQPLHDLERWLGEGWRTAEAPTQAAWFDGDVRWSRPERGPWLALSGQQLFVGLADGSVQTA